MRGMLFLFSKLVGLPVIELESQLKLATTSDVVIDPKDGRFLGFIIKVGSLFPKEQLVATKDIVQLLPTAVLVDNADRISDIDDVIRVRELYKKHFGILNKGVRTKSGKFLGKVDDFLISDEAQMLAKIYVKHLLVDRIIPYSAIVKIDEKKITVKDDFEALSVTDQAEASTEAELA